MFSNSKMSAFDLRGGQLFSNDSEIQKSLNYQMGDLAKLGHGTLSKNLPFFNFDGSLK